MVHMARRIIDAASLLPTPFACRTEHSKFCSAFRTRYVLAAIVHRECQSRRGELRAVRPIAFAELRRLVGLRHDDGTASASNNLVWTLTKTRFAGPESEPHSLSGARQERSPRAKHGNACYPHGRSCDCQRKNVKSCSILEAELS
jgi:hypothetical protein